MLVLNNTAPTTAEELFKVIKFGADLKLNGFEKCLEYIEDDGTQENFENMVFVISAVTAEHQNYTELHMLYYTILLSNVVQYAIKKGFPFPTEILRL